MKTNAIIFRHVWAGALFLVLFGCRKGMIEDQADLTLSSGKQASATTLTNPIVYVAGTKGNQAVYWKDDGTGIATTILSGGTQATGIQVVGTDVYVSGLGVDPLTGNSVAMYWLNGIATTLPNGGSTGDVWTTGITVTAAGDVYISGYLGRFVETAVYWFNGRLVTLTGGELTGPVSVASNGDVYVPNPDYRSYWKSGISYDLNPISGWTSYNAQALTLDGTDVHVAGRAISGSTKIAMYWKNNAPVQLTQSSGYYEARDVAIDASGVAHVAGFGAANWNDEDRVGIWSNGLPGFNKWGTKPFLGTARMDIYGSSIYVCGGEWEDASHLKAKYWMNGTPTNLTDGSVIAYATDIDVVQ